MNISLTDYLQDVKSQLCCNAPDSEFTTFDFTNEQVDSHKDYFKLSRMRGLSPYYALFFFNDYLNNYDHHDPK
jgi:hypothetical protein